MVRTSDDAADLPQHPQRDPFSKVVAIIRDCSPDAISIDAELMNRQWLRAMAQMRVPSIVH